MCQNFIYIKFIYGDPGNKIYGKKRRNAKRF